MTPLCIPLLGVDSNARYCKAKQKVVEILLMKCYKKSDKICEALEDERENFSMPRDDVLEPEFSRIFPQLLRVALRRQHRLYVH